MGEVVLVKNRIKPGKTDRLRDWMEEINSRHSEAIETLQHEGMISEAAFVERTEEADFLIYFMEAEDIGQVYEAFQSSPFEIDREHERVMDDVLVERQSDHDIELLYHLVNPEYRTT